MLKVICSFDGDSVGGSLRFRNILKILEVILVTLS